MKTKEFSSIAVKLIGVVCLLIAALKGGTLISALSYFFDGQEQLAGNWSYLISFLYSFCIPLFAGVFLFFAGDRLGSLIASTDAEIPFPPNGSVLLRVGTALIGISVIAFAVPNLFDALIYAAYMHNIKVEVPDIRKWRPEVIEASTQIVIGTCMFFGGRGIVALRNFIEEGGLKRITQDTDCANGAKTP